MTMGGLFSTKPPKPADPVRMPDEEDPVVLEARRRAAAAATSRSGRTSTVLSRRGAAAQQPANAGTSAYQASFLGNAR
jgi:hypothetical protein